MRTRGRPPPCAVVRPAACAVLLAAAASPGSGCRESREYEGFEQVVGGDFSEWPGDLPDGVSGEVWKPWNGAVVDRVGAPAQPTLRVRSEGQVGGALTLLPTVPGQAYRFDILHRGGSGSVRFVPSGSGDLTPLALPAASGWTAGSAEIEAPTEGLAVLIADEDDGEDLLVDDVSLRVPPPEGEGLVAGEPPIQLVLVVHVEPELDSEAEYQAWLSDLRWLRDEAEERDLVLTVLSNGSFMNAVRDHGDEAEFLDLVARGHEVGTHAHAVFEAEDGTWHAMEVYDLDAAREQWHDARSAVDAVVGAGVNRTIAAYAAAEHMPTLMAEFGFDLDLGSVVTQYPGGPSREAVAWAWLGHHPHHPFRPVDGAGTGRDLLASPDGAYVHFSTPAQIGYPESHGIPTDLDDYRRQLSYLAARRASKAATPEPTGQDLPWVFGVLTHVGVFGEGVEDDLLAFLDDLRTDWLEATDAGGGPVMRAATAQGVRASLVSWEADHPGEVPFSFVLPEIPEE